MVSGPEIEFVMLVVDPRGELVVRFGQPGEGPGDFRDATHAFALPDGRTVVSDNGHLAYQLFDPTGALERWARYPGVAQGETPPLMYVRSADPRLRKVDRWEGGLLAQVTTEYLGTIPDSRLPNAFGPDGLVAYVGLDDFDVPTVVVRRVPEGIR